MKEELSKAYKRIADLETRVHDLTLQSTMVRGRGEGGGGRREREEGGGKEEQHVFLSCMTFDNVHVSVCTEVKGHTLVVYKEKAVQG